MSGNGFCPSAHENLYEGHQTTKTTGGVTVETRIKEYRAHLALTQEDLAKAVGVRRETIVFLEQGKYNPSLKLAHDVARTLHTNIDNLFIFDDETEVPDLQKNPVD
jgi:putative transcriptional regulator